MSTLTLKVYSFLFNNSVNYVTGKHNHVELFTRNRTEVAPPSQRRLEVAPTFDNRQKSWWLVTKRKFDESNAWETERVPVIDRWLIEGGAIALSVLKKQDSFILASIQPCGDTQCPISTWHLEPPLGSLDCEASIIENMSGILDQTPFSDLCLCRPSTGLKLSYISELYTEKEIVMSKYKRYDTFTFVKLKIKSWVKVTKLSIKINAI